MTTGILRLIPLPVGDTAEGCNSTGGASGCGQCAACKRNRRRALARQVESDRPYLGPIPFAVQFPAPGWLTRAHATPRSGGPARYDSLSSTFPPP